MSCAGETFTLVHPQNSLEAAKRRPWYRAALAALGALLERERRRQLWFELEKARQRGLLKELDDRLLADIGVTRDEAEHEARKRFWK